MHANLDGSKSPSVQDRTGLVLSKASAHAVVQGPPERTYKPSLHVGNNAFATLSGAGHDALAVLSAIHEGWETTAPPPSSKPNARKKPRPPPWL